VKDLFETLSMKNPTDSPRVIIARTVKGKGISFMENKAEWHHNRLTRDQYDAAMRELPP
jgi:transketolase